MKNKIGVIIWVLIVLGLSTTTSFFYLETHKFKSE